MELRGGHRDDADACGPRDFIVLPVRQRFDLGLGRRRWGRWPVAAFVRKKSERDAEDVDILRLEQAGVLVDLIRCPPQTATDDLLAEKLA